MVHGMSHKWYLSHFVTVMTQLKIKEIKSYQAGCSCKGEVKKLLFVQKCPSMSLDIIFLKKMTLVMSDECSLWYIWKALKEERCHFK